MKNIQSGTEFAFGTWGFGRRDKEIFLRAYEG